MIVPDINLLLYAYDAESPFHQAAAAWWAECLSGDEQVGLAPTVVFGFVRVGTSGRAFRSPLMPTQAAGHVRAWLRQPVAQVLGTDAAHVEQVLVSLERIGTAGNLVTDAQIAVLAREHDAVVHTSDTDFVRFPGLRWYNPLTGAGGRGPQTGS